MSKYYIPYEPLSTSILSESNEVFDKTAFVHNCLFFHWSIRRRYIKRFCIIFVIYETGRLDDTQKHTMIFFMDTCI